MRNAIVWLATALIATACGAPPPPAPKSDPVTKRTTKSGDVVGFVARNGSHVWRGIPYAAPPAGALLWETPAGTGIVAAPISYELDGAQYVAVMAGWGGAFPLSGGDAAAAAGVARDTNFGRLLVYRLGGGDTLPVHEARAAELAAIPARFDKGLVKRGSDTYARYCAICHGIGAVGAGVLPDLRKSEPAVYDSLDAIVLQGMRSPMGMPRFDAYLKPDDIRAIRAYLLVQRAALR